MYAIYSQSCKTSFTSHIVYRKECMVFCWPGCLFYTISSTPSYLLLRDTPVYCPQFPHHHGYCAQNEQWNSRELKIIFFNHSRGVAWSTLTSVPHSCGRSCSNTPSESQNYVSASLPSTAIQQIWSCEKSKVLPFVCPPPCNSDPFHWKIPLTHTMNINCLRSCDIYRKSEQMVKFKTLHMNKWDFPFLDTCTKTV